MKLPLLFLVTGMILCIVSGIVAQDLQIAHDNKSKTFKTGTLIKVDVPQNEGILCDHCKNNYLIGRIISYKDEILSLRIFIESESIVDSTKEIGSRVKSFKFKNEQTWPVIQILKSNIYSITKQGTKKWKPINDSDTLGAGLTSAGLIFLLSAWAAEGENNADALVGTGITMTGMGLIMITCFNRITFKIENNPNNTDKDKVWIIR